jgi:hypothetical protein
MMGNVYLAGFTRTSFGLELPKGYPKRDRGLIVVLHSVRPIQREVQPLSRIQLESECLVRMFVFEIVLVVKLGIGRKVMLRDRCMCCY